METPDPGAVNFERFNANAKDMYCDIAISVKATKLTGTNGSMADALQTEVKGAYEAAKWNVGRALFGNGQGILASISALGTAGNIITVDNTRNIMEGLIIDIYATGGTVPAVAGRRITAVDRVNNTVTIDGAASTFAAGFITLQKSFKREITGLGAIFDTSITSLYGVDKATNVWLKPTEQDASAGIDDTLYYGLNALSNNMIMADRKLLKNPKGLYYKGTEIIRHKNNIQAVTAFAAQTDGRTKTSKMKGEQIILTTTVYQKIKRGLIPC
jgi:hypothetical protein